MHVLGPDFYCKVCFIIRHNSLTIHIVQDILKVSIMQYCHLRRQLHDHDIC